MDVNNESVFLFHDIAGTNSMTTAAHRKAYKLLCCMFKKLVKNSFTEN